VQSSKTISRRSNTRKKSFRKRSRVSKLRKPVKECRVDRPRVTIRFRCGCSLILKDKQVFLRLQRKPDVGERTRLLGFVQEGVLKIFRRGTDFLRVKGVFGINAHLLESAATLGYTQIYCDTPVRGGFLPPIENLLQRTRFSYAVPGFEQQVGFGPTELRSAS
jgi:hypothetical protein